MLAATISLNLQVYAQNTCISFHRQEECNQASEEGFIYNSQSKSGLFGKGTTSRLKVVFFKGFDYSITLCADILLGEGIGMVMTDAATGEVLYDNATDNKSPHFEFANEASLNAIITVTIPGEGTKKGKAADGACLGILIQQKPTPKTGF